MTFKETYTGADILSIVRTHYANSDAADEDLTAEQVVASGKCYGDTAMDILLCLLASEKHDTEYGTLEECCDELARYPLDKETHTQLGVRVREYESGAREVSWGFGDDYVHIHGIRDLLEHAQLQEDTMPIWFDDEWVEVWDYDASLAYGGRWVTKASIEARDND
ncbi:hypothetical protein [Caballeronia sp. Lep1P3]|uniref:hypothetical protein n=1 Tax=Burkholderiaceae TaxID=119060 RepID=UPI001FD530D8|nr:hypothetical protein [Caballeronia sp. Lep1P3]